MVSTVDTLYGAIFMGVVISTILFGITVLQAYIYYQTYTADPWHHKIAVGWLCFLDTVHLSLITSGTYFHLVTNFGDPTAIGDLGFSLEFQILVTLVMVISIQALYSYRVWQLHNFKKTAILPWIVSFMVLVMLGEGIWLSKRVMDHNGATDKGIAFGTIFSLAWACFFDFFVAGILCHNLAKSRTGFRGTDSVVSTLVAYTLSTGLLSACVYLSALICYLTMTDNMVFFAVEWLVARLYTNSYLAMLNARSSLRGKMGTGGGPSVALSSFSSAGAGHGHGASLSHKGTLSSGGHSVAQTYKRPTTGGLPVAAMPYPGHGGCLAVNVTTISTTHSAGIGPSPGYYSRDGAASTINRYDDEGYEERKVWQDQI